MRGVLCLFESVCSGAADATRASPAAPPPRCCTWARLPTALSNFHNARKARSPIVSIVGEHATQHLRYDAPLSADTAAFARTVGSEVRVLETGAAMGAHRGRGGARRLWTSRPGLGTHHPADFSWSEAGAPAQCPAPHPLRAVATSHRQARRILRSGEPAAIYLSDTAMLERGLELAGRIAAATGAQVFANRFAARWSTGAGRYAAQRIPYFPEAAEPMMAGLRHMILVEADAPVSFFAYPNRRSLIAPEGCQYSRWPTSARTAPPRWRRWPKAVPRTRRALRSNRAARPRPAYPGSHRPYRRRLPAGGAIVSDEMVSASGDVVAFLASSKPWRSVRHRGSIGQGLPVALGAALAAPDRKVIALQAMAAPCTRSRPSGPWPVKARRRGGHLLQPPLPAFSISR